MAFKQRHIEDRRRRVAEYLLARKTGREIAELLGVSRVTVSHDIRQVRAEWREARLAEYDQVVAEELARLAIAEAALWPQVVAGKLLAVDRLLAIMERRARYLGLDAPVKVDITHRLRELAEAEGLDPDEAVAAAQRILRDHT